MSAWQHQSHSDHLRRRAEFHIKNGMSKNAPSAASVGHKQSMMVARQTGSRDSLGAAPYLSEMSGAVALKK